MPFKAIIEADIAASDLTIFFIIFSLSKNYT